MSANVRHAATAISLHQHCERAIAKAYDQAGDDYIAYADGDPKQLYAFDGQYAFGDRRIWELLDAKLCALCARGARSLRVLDLGCGPGTWLRRVVTRAHALGFDSITARGFDVAGAQVRRARVLAANLSIQPGVSLSFETDDIFEPFPEADGSVDLCLCLCGVLNHLPATALTGVFAEISRVTSGHFITTARTIGSTPSVYVDAIDQARRFRQDNKGDRLTVEFQNGRHMSLPSHLFNAAELRSLVQPHLDVEDLFGLDLFHGRFAADPRWNPESGVGEQFAKELERLERDYCRDHEFVDHATHLLLVGVRRKAVNGTEQ